MSEFKWTMKRPCKNCPFLNTEDRITFRGRGRAAEIEESAYRAGFVCHLTAIDTSDEWGEGGLEFAPDGSSQHCAGAILMYLKGGMGGNVPFQWLSEDEQEAIEMNLDWSSPVFEGEEKFLDANT